MNRFILRYPGRLPFEVGEKVEIAGEPGKYLVVRIDRRRCVADLMLMGRNARMEFGVHFAAITPVRQGQSSGWRVLKTNLLAFEGADGDD
jgi:hypothetical protein